MLGVAAEAPLAKRDRLGRSGMQGEQARAGAGCLVGCRGDIYIGADAGRE